VKKLEPDTKKGGGKFAAMGVDAREHALEAVEVKDQSR